MLVVQPVTTSRRHRVPVLPMLSHPLFPNSSRSRCVDDIVAEHTLPPILTLCPLPALTQAFLLPSCCLNLVGPTISQLVCKPTDEQNRFILPPKDLFFHLHFYHPSPFWTPNNLSHRHATSTRGAVIHLSARGTLELLHTSSTSTNLLFSKPAKKKCVPTSSFPPSRSLRPRLLVSQAELCVASHLGTSADRHSAKGINLHAGDHYYHQCCAGNESGMRRCYWHNLDQRPENLSGPA